MAEQVELTDRNSHRMLPKREIPLFHYRDIGAKKCQYGTSNEHNA